MAIDQYRTVCATIKHVYQQLFKDFELAFANGGDQNNNSTPEVSVCQELGIEKIYEFGDKIQSSS